MCDLYITVTLPLRASALGHATTFYIRQVPTEHGAHTPYDVKVGDDVAFFVPHEAGPRPGGHLHHIHAEGVSQVDERADVHHSRGGLFNRVGQQAHGGHEVARDDRGVGNDRKAKLRPTSNTLFF